MRIGSSAYRTMATTGGLAALAALALVAITPAFADDDDGSNPSFLDRMGSGIKESFGNASKAVGLGKPPGPAPTESPSGCPAISILDGTSAQRVMAPGATGNQGLRYQYSLYGVARECSIGAGRMSVRVGANGRVLLGPAGAAGHFDVPIRVVVYSEFDQKPVESKLFRVGASVASGQAGAPFQFVSDAIIVPVGAHAGTEYSIKVGIDGGKGGADVQPKAHRRRKKDVESAATQ